MGDISKEVPGVIDARPEPGGGAVAVFVDVADKAGRAMQEPEFWGSIADTAGNMWSALKEGWGFRETGSPTTAGNILAEQLEEIVTYAPTVAREVLLEGQATCEGYVAETRRAGMYTNELSVQEGKMWTAATYDLPEGVPLESRYAQALNDSYAARRDVETSQEVIDSVMRPKCDVTSGLMGEFRPETGMQPPDPVQSSDVARAPQSPVM